MRSLSTKGVLAALGISFVLQLGCQSTGTAKVGLPQDLEAQKLLDDGITFRATAVQDGPALLTGCGFIDATDYVSSDGVKVRTNNYRCIKTEDASRCFDDNLKAASEVIENEVTLDANQRATGKRLVGARGNDEYFIIHLFGASCPSSTSSSLKHLLAFEKWRGSR